MTYNDETEGKKNVGIYIRVSTEEQATSGVSISAQKEKLEQYCSFNGWIVAREYIDAGLSGSTLYRPEIQRMLDDCRNGLVNVVLVYKLDRLSRSLRDIILTIDELGQYDVDFVSLTEQIDTTTPVGKLMFHIIGAFAECERDIIRQRVIFGMDKKAHDGYVQYKAPFGYEYIDSKLAVNEGEAEIIRSIYGLYLAEGSTYKVAKKFNINQRRVHRILTNETYLGKVKWKEEVIEGCHDHIVNEEVFGRVRQLMEKKRKRKKYDRNKRESQQNDQKEHYEK